jgi:hypothetical protein
VRLIGGHQEEALEGRRVVELEGLREQRRPAALQLDRSLGGGGKVQGRAAAGVDRDDDPVALAAGEVAELDEVSGLGLAAGAQLRRP